MRRPRIPRLAAALLRVALLTVAILLAGSVFAALLGPLARALSIRPADALRYE